MAVEIPVIIDIESAFQDAAKRAKKAMAPLEEYIQSAPIELFIDVEVKGFGKTELINLFDNATTSVTQFQEALDQVNLKIDKLSAKGGFNLLGAGSLTKDESQLLAAAGALEAKLGKVGNASSAMARILSANIKQAESSLNKYIAKLDVLTAKQNKAATVTTVGDKKQLNTGAAYKQYAVEIENVNAKIAETRKFLSFCTLELDNITKASKTAGVAIGQMASYGQLIAAEWTKGHEALMRYNAGLKTANSRIATLAKSLAGMALVYAPVRLIKNIREVTAEFEMQRVALGGIIQDTEKARDLFDQLKAAAIKSPFEIKDLVTYTKQLSAYRIETDKLFNVTMRLADVSAGLGVDMNRLILAYGQVRAASVLRGQELRQFTEAGIPLVELLADKFSQLRGEMVSTADVFELISKRAVPFSMIEEIFNDMTNAGGIFYNMQEKQSETLKGQWMKLKDAVSIMYDEIGNTAVVHEAMQAMMSTLLNMFQSWQKMAKWIGAATTSLIAYKIATANAAVAANALSLREAASISALELNVVGRSKLIAAIWGENKATAVQLKLANAYVRAKKREMLATNLFTKSLAKLQVALLSNPYALAIAAIAALIAGMVTLIATTHKAAITTDEFAKSLTNFQSRTRALGEERDLIDTYEQLADKADKTTEEQKKLDRATKELAKTFPNAITGINAETGALELNIEKIKELNAAEQELELARIRRDENRAKERIKVLEDELNLILRQKEMGGHYAFDLSGQIIPWTEDELAKMGERLIEIRTELAKLKGQVEEVEELDFIGPVISDETRKMAQLKGWKKRLHEIHDEKVKAGMATIFSPNDIETMASVSELWKKTDQGIKDATKNLEGFKNLAKTLTDPDTIASNQKDIEAAQKTLDFWNAIKEAFGFNFSRGTGGDTRLSQLKSDISELTNAYKKFQELTKYKPEQEALIDINKMFPQLKGMVPIFDNVVNELNTRLAKVKADLAKSPKSKTLLDMQRALETEISNLQFDKLKTDLDKQLKKLSDEIKRSETAKNFYNDILGTTGDEDIAANMTISVYGDVGREFKENLQKSLQSALAHFDDRGNIDLWKAMKQALGEGDFETIFKYLDRFPDEWQKRLKEMAESDEKFNADIARNLVKTLEKAKTYGDKQVEIAKKTAKRTADINAMDIPQTAKDALLKQNAKKEAEETAKIQYEAFKDSPMYIELFENLDGASTRMLTNMRNNLIALKSQWKNLSPRELREMQSKINEIDEQLAVRNPFASLIASLREYQNLTKENGSRKEADETAKGLADYARLQKEMLEAAKQRYEAIMNNTDATQEEKEAAKEEMEVQAEETDLAVEQAEAAQETASAFQQAAKHIQDAADGLKEWTGYITTSLDGIGEIVSTFASDYTADTFNIISEGIGKTFGGLTTTASSLARIFAGDLTAIPSLIKGIGDSISGIFGTTKQLKIKSLNEQIEDQQDLLGELEYSYNRLEAAMAKAFGSDYIYNYNQQLKNLAAQQSAYEEQARLEREKGKKADQDKIKDYENSARDVADKIADMQSLLSEFFAGTDVASAAKDFASAWIDAYKQFGSTTDAMKEKFQDMINEMVQSAMFAQLGQYILEDFFKEIDQKAKDGELTAQEVAEIANMAPEYVTKLNDAFTVANNELQKYGLNLRDTVGTFTGISRNIAGASEESITGLTAGINAQNFYMQHIDASVTAILAAMTGGTTVTNVGAEGAVTNPYNEAMMLYAAHIPTIEDKLATLLTEVQKVIKPRSTNPDWALHTVVH